MTAAYRIRLTDERCVIDGAARPYIPVIVGPHGIVPPPSDYLRHLALDSNAPATTLLTYGKVLCQLWMRLHAKGRPWERVNDSFLRRWREEMDNQRRKKRTINQKLQVIHGFYSWAESTGLLSGVVDLTGKQFAQLPISTRIGKSGTPTSPLVFRKLEESLRHTPTDLEVNNLHQVLAGRHAVRDGLIMTFVEQTALRRSEVLSITLHQIPDIDTINALYDRELTHKIHVRIKGGAICEVDLLPSLLEQTLDYIEFERADTLTAARARSPNLRDAGHLFLSEAGSPVSPNHVSKRTAAYFRRAGVKNASLHRLRAVHLTRLAERYIDYKDENGNLLSTETIVLKIQLAARWVGTSSLHRYVEIARSRFADTEATVIKLAANSKLLAEDRNRAPKRQPPSRLA